jgi:hypothetical protein
MFLVPTQAQEDPELVVSSALNGLQDIPLKAIKQSDGDVENQNDFEIEPQHVIKIEQGKDFHVIPSEGSLIAVKATNPQRITTDLEFSQSDGRVTQNLASNPYLLDVIVEMDNDDRFLYETVLTVLAPGQTINQINTQNIIQNFVTSTASSSSHTTVVFRNGDNNNDDDDEDEPSICFFDPNDEACDPDENGDCPEGFGRNEDGRCIPSQRCPDGFHRANDDESGRCIDEDELRECENNGGWVEEGEFCPEDELPFCNEDRSNEPCISGQEETEQEPEPEPITCEEGFILENDVCTETSSNCGGEPCTPSQKEDSWTSDVPESSPGVPITDSEETVEEEETETEEEVKEEN